jgi:hypothetical protein
MASYTWVLRRTAESELVQEARTRYELTSGQILSVFTYSATWDSQERHPGGEALAIVLEGSAHLLLDHGDGEHPVHVDVGSGCVIPSGV